MGDQAQRFAALAMCTARGITRIEQERVCCGSLTLQQFETLRAVQDAAMTGTGVLASKLGIDISTASRNLALLERAGLVKRVRDDADSRIVKAELTPRGAEALQSLCCDERLLFAELLARIPAHRRHVVLEGLEALASALEGGAAAGMEGES